MKRTQIYIEEDVFKILEKESKLKHKTISELVRESIKGKISLRSKEIIKNMHAVFGLWIHKKTDPERYVRVLRKDRTI
jgi:hypothetical protein